MSLTLQSNESSECIALGCMEDLCYKDGWMIKIMTMTETYNPWVSKFLALDNSKIQNPLGNEFFKEVNNFKIYIFIIKSHHVL